MTHINLIDSPWDASLSVMDRAELCGCAAMQNASGNVYELQLTDDLHIVLDEWQARELHELLSGPLSKPSV